MNNLFLTILNMSLAASYAALAVMAVRLLLKKAPKVFSYVLWAVVLFRLLCPLTFESSLSLMPNRADIITNDVIYSQNPEINTSIETVNIAVNQSIQSSVPPVNPAASVDPMQIILQAGMIIWMLGIFIFLSYGIISYFRLKTKLSTATLVEKNIFETDRIRTPFVLGLIKPKIYIPNNLKVSEFDYVVKHENTHIQRYDHIIKLTAFLALVLHWFNPIIWLSYFLMVKDMEMSCDESVMKQSNEDIRAVYSSSLLSFSVKQSGILSPLAFGESNVQSRIKNVLNYRKPTFWVIAASVLAAVFVTVGLMTNPMQGVSLANLNMVSSERLNDSKKIVMERVNTEEEIVITEEHIVNAVIKMLENMHCNKKEISKNRSEVRNEDLKIHLYSDSETAFLIINIGENFSSVWVNNYIKPSFSYNIVNSSQIKQEFKEINSLLAEKNSVKTADSTAVNNDVEKFLQEIIADAPLTSSNPYDYIKDSRAFEELVLLGDTALEYMFEKFTKSNEDGLKEYIMASACAKIMGKFDEQNGIGCKSGREWFYKYLRFGNDADFHIVDADYDLFRDTSGKPKLILPAHTDLNDMEDVISNCILAVNRRAYRIGEKGVEAHKIYRTEEKDGIINVYMLVSFRWFGFEDNIFTVVSGGGGDPVRMQLKRQENGKYEVLEYKQAMDGGMWEKSVREMFPEDLAEVVFKGDEKTNQELWERQVIKAQKYLDEINRSDSQVLSHIVRDKMNEKARKAIYLATMMRQGFPDWNGTREVLVNAGGKPPGIKIRCLLKTNCISGDTGQCIVTLTKTWDIKINGSQPVSFWKYKVTDECVELIDEDDRDNAIKIIK